jgi:hypothetical protein
MKIILSALAVMVLLGAVAPVIAMKPYWTPYNTAIPSDMRAYHLFIDGVNPVWGQNGTDNRKTMQLTHEGLRVGLEYGDSFKPIIFHKIIVSPSAINATYDAGFFIVAENLNESKIWVILKTKYIGAETGQQLQGATSHVDLGVLYSDVSTYRFCIEHHHVKPGTQKFHECYEGAS